jgi:hypothetical protein
MPMVAPRLKSIGRQCACKSDFCHRHSSGVPPPFVFEEHLDALSNVVANLRT